MLAKPHRWVDYLEYDEENYSKLRKDTPEDIKEEYKKYEEKRKKAFDEEGIIY